MEIDYFEGILTEEGIQPPGFSPISGRMLRDIVHRIVREMQPEKIILFGSYAYGKPSSDSDLDIFVIMNTALPYPERIVEVSKLLRPRPCPIDILVRTPQEVDAAIQKGDRFIPDILTHGKLLYDQAKV